MYSTPTIAGSRPGALSVCAWAALVSIGQDGYRERAARIIQATSEIANGIRQIPGLKLMTTNPTMVVCWGTSSDDLNIYRIYDVMSKLGWSLNSLQSPASIHVCVTLNMTGKVWAFLNDLKAATKRVRQEGKAGGEKGTAGIYGVVGVLPTGPIQCILNAFTDMTLTP
jgi:sphinganine-1-phosphate aldolase